MISASSEKEEKEAKIRKSLEMAKSKTKEKKRDLVTNAMDRAVVVDTTTMFDARPLTNIRINQKNLRSVLDCGATVSLLGRGCRELIEEAGIGIMSQHTKYTGPFLGDEHVVIGKAYVPVQYKEQQREILFYLCPSLRQEAYLGSDFFHAFGLAVD